MTARFLSAADIAEETGWSLSTAYRIVNECAPVESPDGGSLRVERSYFERWKLYGARLVPAVTPVMAEAPTRAGVYFAQIAEGGPIKIGVARDVRERMRGLQTANPSPVRLLGVMPGGKEEEAELHKRFQHSRVSGEWFRPTPELVDLAVSHGGVP